MKSVVSRQIAAISLLVALCSSLPYAQAETANALQVERGRYLVSIASCSHCHTPGHFFGRDDMKRFLGGSDVGFTLPDGTTVVGRNLTPDRETGLGSWSVEQIARTIRTGVRPDGRTLIPVMPWIDYQKMTEADALAIAAYLKTLPAIRHRIDGPFAPAQQLTTPHIRMIPEAGTPARSTVPIARNLPAQEHH